MRTKAQSLLEFSFILVVVTLIAVASIQLINKKISNPEDAEIQYSSEQSNTSSNDEKTDMSIDEKNCMQMGLSWDAQNSVCEPK